jgi:hypothetical protein
MAFVGQYVVGGIFSTLPQVRQPEAQEQEGQNF